VKVTRIDLGRGEVEPETAGWSDSMIRQKSLAEIDALIEQNTKVLLQLDQAAEEQRIRVFDLNRIRSRKLELEP
jgi:hypothetical protein